MEIPALGELTQLPQCPECFALKEQLTRANTANKRMKAELEAAKLTKKVTKLEEQREIAAAMPDPDVEPPVTNPASRYRPKPPLEF
jgi:hypothetical protein